MFRTIGRGLMRWSDGRNGLSREAVSLRARRFASQGGRDDFFDDEARVMDGEVEDNGRVITVKEVKPKGVSAAGVRSMDRINDFLRDFPETNFNLDENGNPILDGKNEEPREVEAWDEEIHGPKVVVLPEATNGQFTTAEIVDVLNQRRAMDVQVVDVKKHCAFANCFIIATSRTDRQQKNIAWDIRKMYAQSGLKARIQGLGTDWTVVDCQDIIVHLMSDIARDHLQLEALWTKEVDEKYSMEDDLPLDFEVSDPKRENKRDEFSMRR